VVARKGGKSHIDLATGGGGVDFYLPPYGRSCRLHGFQGHTADRAIARADLPDLWVHRAGVDDRAWLQRRGGRLGLKVRVGRGRESVAATLAAEVVSLALMVAVEGCACRVDRHAAHRIMHSGHILPGAVLPGVHFMGARTPVHEPAAVFA